MNILSAKEKLDIKIANATAQRDAATLALKNEFHNITESFRPINILKSGFKTLRQDKDVKNGIGTTAISAASGYLLKKAVFGATHNPLVKLAGATLQTVAGNFIAKNTDNVKGWIQSGIQNILRRRKKK